MKLFTLLFFLLGLSNLQAANLHEENLGIENSDFLKNQIKGFFFEGDKFSLSKLDEFAAFNKKDRDEEIKLMMENLIHHNGLSYEEALEEALDDKKVHSINYILTNLEVIRNSENPLQYGSTIKNILRVYFALKREARDSAFVHGAKSLGSMILHKHKIPVNDLKKSLPSNLGNFKNGKYFTQSELKELIKNGEDISTIDPVDSSFWVKPSNVAKADPLSKMEKEGTVPNVFKFREMLTREGHPKMEVSDKDENGKKRKWKLKFGREVNNELFCSRFINLLGFYSDRTYYVKFPKVYFKNKKEYEEMLLDWIDYYNTGLDVKPNRYTKETGEDEKGFYAIFYEGLLEERPKSDLRVGDFHVAEMGNWERREVRALLLLMAIVNNPDFKPSRNNRVKLIDNGKDMTKWEVKELVHDLGFAFGGQFISNAPNEFKWSFIQRKRDSIKIDYVNNQWIEKDKNPFQQATYSDLKWIARYLAQITPDQMEQLIANTGWPTAAAKLNLEKMKKRRNEVIRAFGLEGEIIDGNLITLWPEVDPKTFSFGEEIKDGKLVEGYSPEGYPIDYLNINFEPEQIVGLGQLLVGPLLSATRSIPWEKMASFPQDVSGFAFQKFVPGIGVGFRMSRIVEANKEATDENHGWITYDTLDIFVDAGLAGYIPINPALEFKASFELFIGKQYRVSYYSPTPLKAIVGKPKLIAELPFKKKEIVKNLQPGEYYSDGLFVGIDTKQAIRTTGLVSLGAGLKQKQLFLNYREIKRNHNNIMEVSKAKSKSFRFTLAAYLELLDFLKFNFVKVGVEFGTKDSLTYHFNLDESAPFEEREAFHLAAFTNHKNDYLEKIPTSRKEIKYYEKFWSAGVIASIAGGTSGFYTMEEDTEGKITRSFDYTAHIKATSPNKKSDYKVLGHMEFSDEDFKEMTKQNISLEYEFLSHQINFDEMRDQVKYIGNMVNDNSFFKYTPEFHANNHLGEVFIKLGFDLNDQALDCIFEKVKCAAKGPDASKIDRKLKRVRRRDNPIKRMERLGPFLRSTLTSAEDFKNFGQFVGGEKISTELWVDGDVLNRDRMVHLKKEALTY